MDKWGRTQTQGDGSPEDRGDGSRTGGRFYCLDKLNDICYNFVEVRNFAKITKTKKRKRNIPCNA